MGTNMSETMGANIKANTKININNTKFYLRGCALYSVFYVLCLYHNPSGITFPLFAAGNIVLFRLFAAKKNGLQFCNAVPRECIFYEAAVVLLGVSTCITDCAAMIFLNKLAIFVLMNCYFLRAVYSTDSWSFAKHLCSVMRIIIGGLEYLPKPFHDVAECHRASKAARSANAAGNADGNSGSTAGGNIASDNISGTNIAGDNIHRRRISLPPIAKSILMGILIAFPLLCVVVWLLAGADAIFANIVSDILDYLATLNFDIIDAINDIISDLYVILFMGFFAFMAAFCTWLFLNEGYMPSDNPDKAVHNPVTAITFTGILCFVYVLFCLVQFAGLTGAAALPSGYTYAEYARSGFFQLLFVCIINIILVLACLHYYRTSRVLKVVLTVICGCTYIMTFSSAMRMIMYIKAYNLTFLRISVLWALAAIAVIMTGIVVNIYRRSFNMFRYCITAVTLIFVMFSFSRPDYVTARYNYGAMQRRLASEGYNCPDVRNDIIHLTRLSFDAAPIVMSSGFENMCRKADSDSYYKSCIMEWGCQLDATEIGINETAGNQAVRKNADRKRAVSLRTFNLSRYTALCRYKGLK